MRAASVLMSCLLALISVSPGASAARPEPQAFAIREDFGAEPLYDCYLNYYYYIPCPTYSWFWGLSLLSPGERLGVFFQVGDRSMFRDWRCNVETCHRLYAVRFLDFWGGGITYPGLNTLEFEVFCCDEQGCPIGEALWNSGPCETKYGWNYVDVDLPLCLTSCSVGPGPPPVAPRILVTAECIGTEWTYPLWGFDTISRPLEAGCELHEMTSFAALYPRPDVSYYTTMRTGFYGVDFEHCPPLWIPSPDSLGPGGGYGFVEACWRIYLICDGPTEAGPSTWGNIKSMYR